MVNTGQEGREAIALFVNLDGPLHHKKKLVNRCSAKQSGDLHVHLNSDHLRPASSLARSLLPALLASNLQRIIDGKLHSIARMLLTEYVIARSNC